MIDKKTFEILREAVSHSIEIVEENGESLYALNYNKLGALLAQQGITVTLELSHQKESGTLTYDAERKGFNIHLEVTYES